MMNQLEKLRQYYQLDKPINSTENIKLNDYVSTSENGYKFKVGGMMDIDIKGKLTKVIDLNYKDEKEIVRCRSKQKWLYLRS